MCIPYTLPQNNKIASCPEKVFVFGEHMSYYPLLKVQLEEVKDLIFFYQRQKVWTRRTTWTTFYQTCRTVEWPHWLLQNPRDEPLRSCLNDVLGAFMIAFLWNCFCLQQPSCLTAAGWQRKWNFSVTAWTTWSSVSFADVDFQAQLSTIILCYTVLNHTCSIFNSEFWK